MKTATGLTFPLIQLPKKLEATFPEKPQEWQAVSINSTSEEVRSVGFGFGFGGVEAVGFH